MVVLLTALSMLSAVAVPVQAEITLAKPQCASELDLDVPSAKEAAKRTPVVMVHGFTGSPATWTDGSPSTQTVVAQIPGVTVTKLFDYSGSASTRWVTEGDSAHRLAKTIVCSYLLYGGKKVILAAHSMGGLLVRAVRGWAAYGMFVEKAMGHVITLGTPHTGVAPTKVIYIANISLCNVTFAWWGREASENCERIEGSKAVSAMRPDSPQLALLPGFPEGVTVKAIAGNVSWQVCAPWGSCANPVSQGGDVVVLEESATDKYTETGHGDGKRVFKCVTSTPVALVSDAWCDHNRMVHAPVVQAEVKRSIQEYLASVTRANSRKVTFRGLELHVGDQWKVSDQGGRTVELERCSGEGCTKLTLYPERPANAAELIEGFRDCGAPAIEKGRSQVGGREAIYFEGEDCGPELDKANRIWLVPGVMTIVAESPSPSTRNGVDDLLTRAAWN